MTDLPRYPGTPRWAKIMGTLIAAVIVLFLIGLVAKGPHGPRAHFALDDNGTGDSERARH